MRFIKHIFFWYCCAATFAQEQVQVTLTDKISLKDYTFVSVDNFGAIFTIAENAIVKQNHNSEYIYNNYTLGEITSFNTFNPLKLNVFYKDFNTVVILDNRLAEITKVNFNQLQPQRIISHIATAHNNNIWLFNENSRQLELFDFIAQKTSHTSLPLEGIIHDIDSNYNMCWVLTDNFIYGINYFGSIIQKTINKGFTRLKQHHGDLLLQKENSLFILSKSDNKIKAISLPELLIKQFFVTNETLYIYDGEMLHQYQLIND